MKKRIFGILAAAIMLLPTLALLGGCGGKQADVILKVYSWAEYIDEGGEGSYLYDTLAEEKGEGAVSASDAPPILDDFEKWYEETYHESIRVDYATFGTNEDMYNEIVLGNEYDLLCPSDYMIMKLAAEDRIVPYDASFFDSADPNNYYVRNVSPYIRDVFENGTVTVTQDGEQAAHKWSEYAAGYMWGTTGFVYNPEHVERDDLEALGWQTFVSDKYTNKITAKDNVRDTYFAALGLTYEQELLALDKSGDGYNQALTDIFNRTAEQYTDAVGDTLLDMKKNIYGFETDTGKADMVSGKIWLNYAWSGDAVYALDEAEEDDLYLEYFVPEAGSNLWFDGWVLTKGVEERGTKKAAQAFVNYMSMPESAKRNSYYIGYTSVIAGENTTDENGEAYNEMLDYADWLYGYEFDPETEDEPAETVDYDLTYFFLGADAEEGQTVITAEKDSAEKRQLFAQFPPEDVIARCAVMNYFDADTSERINELWSHVKAETLDTWAIVVLCVAAVAIVAFVLLVKFGNKIDLFRPKPKKGYELVEQEAPKNDYEPVNKEKSKE